MSRKILNGLDLAGQRVANLGDPSASMDAVNLQYLQAYVRGLSWKQPVRAASTTNVTLATPGATLDGVTLVAGDRILLKDQTAGATNGVYVWTGASATLTRAADADASAELEDAAVLVTEGSSNANRMFVQSANGVTLGTTTLVWAQFGGSSTPYTAGTGLTLVGQAFAVNAGPGLLSDVTNVRVDPSVVVRKYAANVPAGSTNVTITHNLGTLDVLVQVVVVSTGEVVEPDITIPTTNTVTLGFATAPTAAQYRVVVHG